MGMHSYSERDLRDRLADTLPKPNRAHHSLRNRLTLGEESGFRRGEKRRDSLYQTGERSALK
jgi:hypothetical protein